jgi:hypothetical protein
MIERNEIAQGIPEKPLISKEELHAIKSRLGTVKAQHQRIRALSETTYRIVAHDIFLLLAALEPLLLAKENGELQKSPKVYSV